MATLPSTWQLSKLSPLIWLKAPEKVSKWSMSWDFVIIYCCFLWIVDKFSSFICSSKLYWKNKLSCNSQLLLKSVEANRRCRVLYLCITCKPIINRTNTMQLLNFSWRHCECRWWKTQFGLGNQRRNSGTSGLYPGQRTTEQWWNERETHAFWMCI